MPASAAATLPAASATAPVKAPFTWPKRSLCSSSLERLGQLTVTNGPERRALRRWISRARTVLPVPLGPSRRMVDGRGRRLEGDLQRPLHDRLRRLEVDRRSRARQLRLQRKHAPLQGAALVDLRQDGADLVGGERLRNEIERAAPHRLDRRRDVGVGREHDHGEVRPRLQQPGQHLQPVLRAQPDVQEDGVERLLLHKLEGPGAVRRLGTAVCPAVSTAIRVVFGSRLRRR